MKEMARKICLIVFVVLFIIGIIHLGNAIFFGRNIAFVKREFILSEENSKLKGTRIALITDTHYISPEHLEEIVAQMNKDSVDILAIVGDMHKSAEYGTKILAKTKTRYGIFAVEGNHDYNIDLKNIFRENNVVYLDNEGQSIVDGLFIAGVSDLWYSNPNPPEAMKNTNAQNLNILLAHNPDISKDFDCSMADLVLSGHTHGGHVTLFGIFKPFLSGVTRYPSEFGGGWASGANGESVYVSKGTGYYNKIHLSRVFSRPEVVYIDLIAT